ncbi:MAG: DUF3341 domain-containing protein [Planctomycetes bacterium]|nr:DUF3341 domain-containing protein [Planctomycetota bacterium]
MSRRLHLGIFTDAHALVAAARACRSRGIPIRDAYTPHPVHGLDEAMALRPSRLPIACFVGGLAGLVAALAFQYWASAQDWPIDVGGKPFHSWPAFVPVAFELMVLCAGLLTALLLLVRSRLLPGAASVAPCERVSDDRYALVVEERDARLPADAIAALLAEHGAIERRELPSATETEDAP